MKNSRTIVLVGVVLVLSSTLAFVALTGSTMQEEKNALTQTLEQQNVRIQDYEDIIAQQNEQLEAHQEFIRVLRAQNNQNDTSLANIEAMVAQATQGITDIKKLEEADKELLAKYSKVFFLNEHYTPTKLAVIPLSYTNDKQLQLEALVLPFAVDMLNTMEGDGLAPVVSSAYRSFSYQADLKHRNAVTYGAGTANQFVADQGYSEHQLGTTLDFSSSALGGELMGFENTPEYAWLQQNAHRYGFALSYPKNNAYYAFEPWHWRFVGVALATKLHKQGVYFYDMSQRDIDAYRLQLFER